MTNILYPSKSRRFMSEAVVAAFALMNAWLGLRLAIGLMREDIPPGDQTSGAR